MRVLAVLLFLFFVRPLAADVIHVRGGPSITGVLVIEENRKAVRYRERDGATREVPSASVVFIVRQDAPRAFMSALEAFQRHDWARAFAGMQALIEPKAGAPAWLAEYALFYAGRAALAAGRLDDAHADLEKLLTVHPETRFLFDATIAATVAEILRGRHESARARLEARRRTVPDAEVDPAWGDRADILLAMIEAADGRRAAADDLLGAIALRAAGDPARRGAALTAKRLIIRSAIRAGETERARALIVELAARTEEGGPAARVSVEIARGELALAEGRGLYEAARAIARLRPYLAVDDPEAADATLLIADLRTALGADDPQQKAAGVSYLEETVRMFPESLAGGLARKRLEKN